MKVTFTKMTLIILYLKQEKEQVNYLVWTKQSKKQLDEIFNCRFSILCNVLFLT